MRIGFLIVATHKYIRFVQPLLDSMKRHLNIPGAEIKMFVFTDQPNVPDGCVRIQQEHRPFPYPTLMRYHMFYKNRINYEHYDYLYYLDADMLFLGSVGNEIIADRLGVLHPGFFRKTRTDFTYEHRQESLAYVSPHEGKNYFCGGFNGGKASVYLEMSRVISERVDKDHERGIEAIWHDESHLNRYYIDNPPTVILNPSYCYPGDGLAHVLGLAGLPKKIHAIDKNHDEVRN